MIIDTHRKFEKNFKNLPKHLKEKTSETIERFSENPFNASLWNHPLHGQMKGKRAISVSHGYRITFKEFENYERILLLNVGTHDQVY